MLVRSDEQIQRAVDGDRDALSELLKEHGPLVERMLKIDPIWQSMIEPSDVMQVTYTEAFLRISTFDPQRGTPFASWLKAIAENNLRDAVRGLSRKKQPPPRARVQPAGYEDSLVGLYNMLAAGSGTPSAKVRNQELIRAVEQAIAELPERYSQVVRLYDIEGRTIDEVMKATSRSSGAVYMLRARAHQRLAELLGSASALFG